jgi:hypothetical protein
MKEEAPPKEDDAAGDLSTLSLYVHSICYRAFIY